MKCNNCGKGVCERDAVVFFEYIGPHELISLREPGRQEHVIASCKIHAQSWDQDEWRIISEEEYMVGKILYD